MSVYVINMVSILIYALLIGKFNNKYQKSMMRYDQYEWRYSIIFTTIIIVQLLLLSILKSDGIGYDNINYANEFSKISGMGIKDIVMHRWETGYVFVNRLIGFLGFDFRMFVVSMFLVLYSIIYRFLIKESKIPWLSLFLFIAFDHFSFSMSVYRQFIAMVLTMISIKYIRESKLIKFIFIIFIGSLFHQSAIAFLIIYPISKFKLTRKLYLLALSAITFLYLFGGYFINVLLSIYEREQVVVSGSGKNYFLMIAAFTIFGIYIFHTFGSEIEERLREDTKIYIQIMITAVVFQVLSFHVSIFVRVVYYFSFYLIIFIPNLLKFIPKGYRRDTVLVGIFSMGIVLFFYNLLTNTNGILPYKFLWQ